MRHLRFCALLLLVFPALARAQVEDRVSPMVDASQRLLLQALSSPRVSAKDKESAKWEWDRISRTHQRLGDECRQLGVALDQLVDSLDREERGLVSRRDLLEKTSRQIEREQKELREIDARIDRQIAAHNADDPPYANTPQADAYLRRSGHLNAEKANIRLRLQAQNQVIDTHNRQGNAWNAEKRAYFERRQRDVPAAENRHRNCLDNHRILVFSPAKQLSARLRDILAAAGIPTRVTVVTEPPPPRTGPEGAPEPAPAPPPGPGSGASDSPARPDVSPPPRAPSKAAKRLERLEALTSLLREQVQRFERRAEELSRDPDPGQRESGERFRKLAQRKREREERLQQRMEKLRQQVAEEPVPPEIAPGATAKGDHLERKKLQQEELQRLRRQLDAAAALGRALRDSGASDPTKAVELGQELAKGMRAIEPSWERVRLASVLGRALREAGVGDWKDGAAIAVALGEALQSLGGLADAGPAATGVTVGLALRQLRSRIFSEAPRLGGLVGASLREARSVPLHEAEAVATAVGAALRSTRAAWLGSPRATGESIAAALKEMAGGMGWEKSPSERGRAMAVALARAGSSFLDRSAEVGQAIGTAARTTTGKVPLDLVETLGAGLGELWAAAPPLAPWLRWGGELTRAAGTALREALENRLAKDLDPGSTAVRLVAACIEQVARRSPWSEQSLKEWIEKVSALRPKARDLDTAWAVTRGIGRGLWLGGEAFAKGAVTLGREALNTLYDSYQYVARAIAGHRNGDPRPVAEYRPRSFLWKVSQDGQWAEVGAAVWVAAKEAPGRLWQGSKEWWADLTSGDKARQERAGKIMGRGFFEVGSALIPASELAQLVKVNRVAEAAGVSTEAVRTLMRVAEEESVVVRIMETNPHAIALRKLGHPPKPGFLKMKSAGELDVVLGVPKDALGRVVFFKPKPPKKIPRGVDPEQVWARYRQRLEEFEDFGREVRRLEQEGKIGVTRGGVIVDAKTRKAFTSDTDLFDIRDMNGVKFDDPRRERILAKLKEGGVDIEHGALRDWKTEEITDAAKRAQAEKIKETIIDSHLERTSSGETGETLVEFRPGRKVRRSHSSSAGSP
jgi:hypothetical protein